jgi:type II secretory pathway pseudopilin PulG
MNRQQRTTCRERSRAAPRGFVLTELMVALGIFMLLSAAVINVYLMSLRTWREGSAQVSLQRKLAAAMQRIVQGERSQAEARQHGLREAEAITVADEHTIDFTSGVDGTTRRFYLKGNEIVYDPDTGNSAKAERTIYDPSRSESADETSTYRTDLEFAQVGDGTIEIRLTGQERVLGRWMNAALVTRVAPRN